MPILYRRKPIFIAAGAGASASAGAGAGGGGSGGGGGGGQEQVAAESLGKVVVYEGNGATQDITGFGFDPGIVFIKGRETTQGWRIVDSVRGVGLSLSCNTTTAEAEEADGVTAFITDGFSLGSDTDYNTNGHPYLAWGMKLDPDAISVVTYTGTGTTQTIEHGLSAAPKFIAIHNRSVTGDNWGTYPGWVSNPGTKFLQFQTNIAVGTTNTTWNDTDATDTEFTVHTAHSVNANTEDYAGFCFTDKEGLLKIGTYVGNNLTDGPEVTGLGFKPKVILFKASSGVGDWQLVDDTRDASSPHSLYITTNKALTDNLFNVGVHFTDDGFRLEDVAGSALNADGVTHMYMAMR